MDGHSRINSSPSGDARLSNAAALIEDLTGDNL